ncbi:hypothetical protein, partial [Prevotella pallens]|uniref:hypothetical protein n=1 Tax=Prevotella pallens TaxID=60133 RepID=UPI0023F7CD4B
NCVLKSIGLQLGFRTDPKIICNAYYLLTNRIEYCKCLEKPVGHLFRLFHKSTAFVANIYHVRFRYL